jgi:uncharacterized protein YecE (DUF72 family)
MGRRGRAYIGTSGWRYAAWREDLYGGRPARLGRAALRRG